MKYIPKLRSKSPRMYLPLLFKRPKKLSNLSSFLSDSMSGLASISGRHNSSFKTTAVIKIEVLSLRSFLSLYFFWTAFTLFTVQNYPYLSYTGPWHSLLVLPLFTSCFSVSPFKPTLFCYLHTKIVNSRQVRLLCSQDYLLSLIFWTNSKPRIV